MTLTKRACWSKGTICIKEAVGTRDTLGVTQQPMGTTWLTVDGRDPLLLKATMTSKKGPTKKLSSIERERVKKDTWPTLGWKSELFHLHFPGLPKIFLHNINILCFHDAVQSTTDFLLCSDLEKPQTPSTPLS